LTNIIYTTVDADTHVLLSALSIIGCFMHNSKQQKRDRFTRPISSHNLFLRAKHVAWKIYQLSQNWFARLGSALCSKPAVPGKYIQYVIHCALYTDSRVALLKIDNNSFTQAALPGMLQTLHCFDAIVKSQMHQIQIYLGSAPDPALGAYSFPPDLLLAGGEWARCPLARNSFTALGRLGRERLTLSIPIFYSVVPPMLFQLIDEHGSFAVHSRWLVIIWLVSGQSWRQLV